MAQASIAQVHLAAERYADAAEAARRALALNPRHKEARYALANALLRAGDEEHGRQELAAARQLQADDLNRTREGFATNLLRIEAGLREQEGKFDAAAALWQQVTERAAGTVPDLVSLGDALSKAGRHADAAAAYVRASTIAATPDIYRSLVQAYVSLGRTADADAARAMYEQVKRQRLLEMAAGR